MSSIPHSFFTYPAGNFPASDWDDNWRFVGALTNIWCITSGSANSIVLAPAPTSPAVTAYQSGMKFTFVAIASNTGAVTLSVASLPAMPVFDLVGAGISGAGSIIAGGYYEVVYDQSLNAGGGGFRIRAGTGGGIVTDPGARWPFTSFGGPGFTIKGITGGQATWDSGNAGENGAAAVFESVVNAGAGNIGAPGGMFVGCRVTVDIPGLDPHGMAACMYNEASVTNALGTAAFFLIRGGNANNPAYPFGGPLGVNIVNEVNVGGGHARAAAYIAGLDVNRRFRRGIWVANAVDYGFLVGMDPGGPQDGQPTWAYAVLNTSGVRTFGVEGNTGGVHSGLMALKDASTAFEAQLVANSLGALSANRTLTLDMANKAATLQVNARTWTPVLRFGGTDITTAGGGAYSVRTGAFFQYGGLVLATYSITLTAKGTATGRASITGLAVGGSFAAPTSPGGGAVVHYGNMNAAASPSNLMWTDGVIYVESAAAGNSQTDLNDTNFTNTTQLTGFIVFIPA